MKLIHYLFLIGLESSNEVRVTLQNTNNINIFDNGTLLIEEMSMDQSGYYYCKVSNGIGVGLNTVVQVQVYGTLCYFEWIKYFQPIEVC